MFIVGYLEEYIFC